MRESAGVLRVPKLVGQFRPETTWTRRKCAVKCDLCEVEPREESGQNYVKINREKNLAINIKPLIVDIS